MRTKAIIFGSLGALYETGDIERRAFNAAFQESGLDWKWDVDLYRDLKANTAPGQLISSFAEDRGLVLDCAAILARKSDHYHALLASERLLPRPGVLSVISAASAAAVPLGLATTDAEGAVSTVLKAPNSFLCERLFAFVGSANMVSQDKPSPEIYALALSRLGVSDQEAVVIEDTAEGVRAAALLKIRTLAYPGRYASGDFSPAEAQVTRLSLDAIGLGCQMRDFALAG